MGPSLSRFGATTLAASVGFWLLLMAGSSVGGASGSSFCGGAFFGAFLFALGIASIQALLHWLLRSVNPPAVSIALLATLVALPLGRLGIGLAKGEWPQGPWTEVTPVDRDIVEHLSGRSESRANPGELSDAWCIPDEPRLSPPKAPGTVIGSSYLIRCGVDDATEEFRILTADGRVWEWRHYTSAIENAAWSMLELFSFPIALVACVIGHRASKDSQDGA